jgi:MFS family permease
MLGGPRNPRDATSPGESGHALDWLNFSLAALLMGFGPFLPVHLADRSWTPEGIGLVLTISGLAGLAAQIPAGELIDAVRSKRALIAGGSAAAALALLIFGLRPNFPAAIAAALVQGAAVSLLSPAVAAISLGLVGHDALAERLGRNQRFASIGGVAAAAVMGAIGYLLSTGDIFVLAAALWVPLLVALLRIRASDIHFSRSCGAPNHDERPQRVSRIVLFKDRRLLTFAVCLFLFQLANASLLPQLGQTLAHVEGHLSSLVVAALVVGPQIVVAVLAPWAGRTAATWGRRPLLVIGLAAVPIRAGLFALSANPALLIVLQLLDGLSGATLGVLTALVVADITAGTGRFNLAQGLVGTLSTIGASLSTSLSGVIVQRFGPTAGLLSVTAVGLLAVGAGLRFMPETKPPARTDAEQGGGNRRVWNFEPAMTVSQVGHRLMRFRRRSRPTRA